MHPKLGYWLIMIPAVASVFVPAAVDLNDSHLFNEDWPPHARLHDAMSFLMSIGLGAAAIWMIRRPEWRSGAPLAVAAILSCWSWVSLLLAGLFPGATYSTASEGEPVPSIAGVPVLPNAVLSIVLVVMALVGWRLLAKAAATSSSRAGTRT